jgi:cardiolipin synthase (CMP-forming)
MVRWMSSVPGKDAAPSRWPMRLTLVRLWMLPFLWLLAGLGRTSWLGLGVAAAAVTDVIDGILARALHQTTERGSRLDSLADHLLSASIICWLLWLRPDFVRNELPLLAGWAILGATALLVGWVKHRRFGDLHLYSAKVAGFLAYLLAIWILLFGTYRPIVFRVVAALCVIAAMETLLVFSTRRSVDERVGSVLFRPRHEASGRRTRGDRGTDQEPPLND